MTQWLRVLTDVTEDLGWVPRTDIVPQKLVVAPVLWDRKCSCIYMVRMNSSGHINQ